jgi:hypothetical protein
MGMYDDDRALYKEYIVKDLKKKIENGIHKIGNDGTRYYLLSREELEDIIELLER